MANIMINQVCNLACPYCFANEYVNKPETCKNHKQNISIENFRTALKFISKTQSHVGIIGGEPTLHPEFEKLLKIIIENPVIQTANLFTNGIEVDKYHLILANRKFTYLVNCNSSSNMGQEKYSKMVSNLDKMHNDWFIGDRTSLGINMYKPDFEYEYMLELLKRYNKKTVRVSICVPNTDDKRSLKPLDYFKLMKPRVLQFFQELKELKIVPHFDCNSLPLCQISNADYGFIRDFYEMGEDPRRINLLDGNMCSPVIDIMPDLSTARCFGIKPEKPAVITDFETLEELSAYYTMQFDRIGATIPVDESCKDCKQFNTGSCLGGCLSFKRKQIDKVRTLADNIYIDDSIQ